MMIRHSRFLQPSSGDFIWFLGLGYFLCYIPYAALTKATTSGLLPGIAPVAGTVILPVSAMVTLLATYLFISVRGWWGYPVHRRILGRSLPVPRRATLVSGIATAVIIGTTTMAFSFEEVSIVFSLILMRGGVLIIARVTDAVSNRRVAWYSLAGMLFTLTALFVLFSENGGLAMSLPAAINLSLYLAGYTVRFQVMRKLTKTRDQDLRKRYFVEELMVAMPALIVGLAAVALLATDPLSQGLTTGFLSIWTSPVLVAAAFIGLGYASLYVFGTMIYLDAREYTFCVPVNRASSILSGVVATYVLYYLADYAAPSAYQLVAAGLLLTAILVMGLPTIGREGAERLYLFVCNGNRLRSPMAQAICHSYLAKRLGLSPDRLGDRGVLVKSAGLEVATGAEMKPDAKTALTQLGIDPQNHVTRPLTAKMIARAERVFCMTRAQREAILNLVPNANAKVQMLDESDIDEPKNLAEAIGFGHRLGELIRRNFGQLSF